MKTLTTVVLEKLIDWESELNRQLSLTIFVLIISSVAVVAQSASKKYLMRSTISNAGWSEQIAVHGNDYVIHQSVGQASSIKTYKANQHTVRQGFIQPIELSLIKPKLVALKIDVVAYPNPFVDHISLRFSEEIEGDIELVLYDLFGQVVYTNQQYVNHNDIKVMMPDIAHAMYILKIQYEGTQFVKQIIKK